jgi:hypothetical protein
MRDFTVPLEILMLNPSNFAGLKKAAVHPGEAAFHGGSQEGVMRPFPKKIVHLPEVFLCRHPIQVIETGEIQRPRVTPQCLFSVQVVIMLEVAHDQFPDGPVYRFPETQAGIIGFADGTPVTPELKDCHHMIVVPRGFKVDN